MNGSKTQLALREWRAEMSSSVTWVALLGVASVLTLVGPFDTDITLGFVQRFFFWLVLCVLTYGAGGLLNGLVRRWLEGRSVGLIIVCAGSVTGLAVSAIVFVVNWLVFGYLPDKAEAAPFFATVFAIGFVVTYVLFYIGKRLEATPQPHPQPKPAAEAKPVPLLDRIPLEKRGPLVALSVEDHYVRIQTLKGEEMVLMRLSDAIKEVGSTRGAQVHRSHWVAFAHVTAAKRSGDRAILTLGTGGEVPVSRANLPKIKEAGLLPR